MKRALCLILILLSVHNIWGQDFASKFMEQYTESDGLQCQTVSPKMMEKIMEFTDTSDEKQKKEISEHLLSKLKSARIITVTKHCKKNFRKAEQLIEMNSNRFAPWKENTSETNNRLFVRKHDDVIRELVMLNWLPEEKIFTIINFTGEMDDLFMQQLSSGNLKQN